MIGLYLLIGVITGGVVAHHFNLNVSVLASTKWDFYNYYNNKPYIRLSPYVLGIGSGFVYFTSVASHDDNLSNLIIKLLKNKTVRFCNLIFGLVLWILVLNVQIDVYEHPGKNFDYDKWSDNQNAAYFAFVRLLLGLAYTLMFTPMVLGHFG